MSLTVEFELNQVLSKGGELRVVLQDYREEGDSQERLIVDLRIPGKVYWWELEVYPNNTGTLLGQVSGYGGGRIIPSIKAFLVKEGIDFDIF